MTPFPLRPRALLIAVTAMSALFPLVAAVPATARDADPGPRRFGHHRHTADEITRFLVDFYGDHGPRPEERRLRTSQQLKDKQNGTPDFDVVLCAGDRPERIEVGPATVARAAGVGWATVTTHWGDGETDTFTAYVRLDSRPIQLDDVICAG
ncbi:hypothetical protein [Streptomyces sp. RerS4]|uniref:hypothetical protein n=1 Tax=Streptomyces sp. RerS4 TaxID=2942449 RepID=UPI00201C5BE8|nr:hypothetical protein [Streptomyces sp. RerS4]UQW99780.1 hypothetical protein M4D82_03935 [Streptomyces sp. RerS4]